MLVFRRHRQHANKVYRLQSSALRRRHHGRDRRRSIIP
jgi:hypothetical protein